jgi:malate dehydrogenase (oxaloacetate-decarboxylating)
LFTYANGKAEAISNFSRLFRRSEGLYLSFPNIDTMEEDFLDQIKGRSVDLVVCSDAEAILGIGDQGVGGIGVSLSTHALTSDHTVIDIYGQGCYLHVWNL